MARLDRLSLGLRFLMALYSDARVVSITKQKTQMIKQEMEEEDAAMVQSDEHGMPKEGSVNQNHWETDVQHELQLLHDLGVIRIVKPIPEEDKDNSENEDDSDRVRFE